MSKKGQEKNESKGPVARDSNPERFGNGGAQSDKEAQEAGKQPETRTEGSDPANPGEPVTGAESATGETGGANPGTAAPQDVIQEATEGRHPAVTGDPIIDRDPGDEAFMREHGASGAASGRTVDESPEFNQDRDVAIEGLQDGPGGRKYLILNLTDDTHAQAAAGHYAELLRKHEPAKAELAAQLFRLAGINVGRR